MNVSCSRPCNTRTTKALVIIDQEDECVLAVDHATQGPQNISICFVCSKFRNTGALKGNYQGSNISSLTIYTMKKRKRRQPKGSSPSYQHHTMAHLTTPFFNVTVGPSISMNIPLQDQNNAP